MQEEKKDRGFVRDESIACPLLRSGRELCLYTVEKRVAGCKTERRKGGILKLQQHSL